MYIQSLRRFFYMNRKQVLFWMASVVLAMTVLIAIAYLLVRFQLFGPVPSSKTLKSIENHNASEILAYGGEQLGKFFHYDRTSVSLENPSFASIYPLPFGASRTAAAVWSDYMQDAHKLEKTRLWAFGKFEELPIELQDVFDCPDYLVELPRASWLERLFGIPDSKKNRVSRPIGGETAKKKPFPKNH